MNAPSIWREQLRSGLWVVPLAMLPLTLLLYLGALWLNSRVPDEVVLRTWWLHGGSDDDARNLLSTLVTAIITMSSVVFSITVVTLSLAANQFGSRMVRLYLANIRTKLALGLFTMTIVYCLLGLLSVEKDMPPADVPHVAVTLGLLLGVACVLTLLLFLHVVARSIVADEVIRRVAGELEGNIAHLEPLPVGHRAVPPDDGVLPEDFEARSVILSSRDEGYVQAIEYEGLIELASRRGLLLRLDFRAGEFMCREGSLGAVYPSEAVSQRIVQSIQDKILIGAQRTSPGPGVLDPPSDRHRAARALAEHQRREHGPGRGRLPPGRAVAAHGQVPAHLRLPRCLGSAAPGLQAQQPRRHPRHGPEPDPPGRSQAAQSCRTTRPTGRRSSSRAASHWGPLHRPPSPARGRARRRVLFQEATSQYEKGRGPSIQSSPWAVA